MSRLGFRSKLLSLLFLLQIFPIALCDQNFTYYECIDMYGTYTSNSPYKTNLVKVLSLISSNTKIDYGYYNFSAGEDPDQVNAVALCRGDVTKRDCQKCRNDATSLLPLKCPKQMEAVGWYPNCTLWYSTRSIFGVFDDGRVPFEIFYTDGAVPDSNQFTPVLSRLLNDTNAKAALGDSRLKYATSETSVISNGTIFKIYALSQCNPGLSINSCFTCLTYLTKLHFKCCGDETTAWFAGPSCNIRYEPNQFYNGAPLMLEAMSAPSPAPTISPGMSAPVPTPPIVSMRPRTPPPGSSIGSGEKSSKTKTVDIIIAVISTVASLALAIIIGCWLLRRRKIRRVYQESKVRISSAESVEYDFSTVKAATDNFSQANKLGHGGFGAVYKGKLSDGQEIAVKRLTSNNSGHGEEQFRNEITLLAKLQHRNLVRLFGFCLEKEERILIYEFVQNASLDHFLFDTPQQGGLDWSKRGQIIGGIAQGLVYLHEHSRLKIIHRDLKPANILLDAEMIPKIADFGLARLYLADATHENASKVAGTFGYMAPEYTRHRQFSVKSDVYSFGILLLEIICGRRNGDFFEEEFAAGLVSLVWKNWREGTILSVVDSQVGLDSSLETEVTRYLHIGLLCVQKNPADRPTMSSVIIWLSSESALPSPSFPGYISATYQAPQQASDSDNSTSGSYVSTTVSGNSATSHIHPLQEQSSTEN